MKILVIGLDSAAPEPLFGLPDLTNVRRLMDAGCYGRLESITSPGTQNESVCPVPAWVWLRDQIAATTGRDLAAVRHAQAESQWDEFQFIEVNSDDSQYLDDRIGSLLDLLDDQSAVLVLSDHVDRNHAQHGAFILALPNCPLTGELEGIHLLDMAPTLLELGGYDVPPTMQGRSLVAEACGGVLEPALADSDEELVRQRLSGLGYI